MEGDPACFLSNEGCSPRAHCPSGRFTVFTHLIMHKAHVLRIEHGSPLAAEAWLEGSGQLLQRPLVVGIELVGQGQVKLFGAWFHHAVWRGGNNAGTWGSALPLTPCNLGGGKHRSGGLSSPICPLLCSIPCVNDLNQAML